MVVTVHDINKYLAGKVPEDKIQELADIIQSKNMYWVGEKELESIADDIIAGVPIESAITMEIISKEKEKGEEPTGLKKLFTEAFENDEEPIAVNTPPMYEPPKCDKCNEKIADTIEGACNMVNMDDDERSECMEVVEEIHKGNIVNAMNKLERLLLLMGPEKTFKLSQLIEEPMKNILYKYKK